MPLRDIVNRYSAVGHEGVVSGYMTEADAMTEFIQSWDRSTESYVSMEEFRDYWLNVGAAFDNDDNFETVMKSAFTL